MEKDSKIFSISKRTFAVAVFVLAFLLIVSAVLTYVIPKGSFATVTDESGNVTVDYSVYTQSDLKRGIPVWKAVLSPLLVFTADGAIQPIMLMLFLLIISSVFQIMKDCGAMSAIVGGIVGKFRYRKRLLIACIVLLFMLLGSLFGLFEETLIVLPMVISVCAGLGYDAPTGFLICTLATGFGFSAAITNPFTVVYASDIIGADVASSAWFRVIIFAVYYLVVLSFAFIHIKRLKKTEPAADNTDAKPEGTRNRRALIVYTVFLSLVFAAIIVISSVDSLRDLSTPLLAGIFLIGGSAAGIICWGLKKSVKSFLNGALTAAPALLLICLAFAVKYILTEGMILDTITYNLARLVQEKPPFVTVLILFAIILFLEFFISSSTSKAVFVMGVLSGVVESGALNISRELLVLIYIFSDGFTNMIFPTSPVLLISLSMTDMDYLGWLKKGRCLFAVTFLLAFAFLFIGILIGY